MPRARTVFFFAGDLAAGLRAAGFFFLAEAGGPLPTVQRIRPADEPVVQRLRRQQLAAVGRSGQGRKTIGGISAAALTPHWKAQGPLALQP